MDNISKYTISEEIANAITHGIGALLSAAALALLIMFACLYGNVWHIVSFSIYGATLVLLYLISTLYHSFQNQKVKSIFRILDHASIYLLIAGTYTPLALITLKGPLGWTIFGIVWGIALVGISLKVFFVKRFMILSTIFYIMMGWVIVFAMKPLLLAMPFNGIVWLIIGGVL
ncbi:MAG: hemolysin III family protein, partial [Clostridia bacterium]|nr:hemolysin III family protein [Clostridia bacterium]